MVSDMKLIFKAFSEPEMLEFCTPIIYGSPKVAAYYRKAMNLPAQFSIIQKAEDAEDGRINLLAAVDEEVKVDMGLPTDESGAAAIKALDRAMTDYRNNLYDVLITAPVSSQNVKIEGYTFKGHKEYIETCIGDRNSALSILIGGDLRIAAITEKTPLAQVAGAISQESIVSKTTLLWQTLKRDFLITNPRIAVLALNPSINEEHELRQRGTLKSSSRLSTTLLTRESRRLVLTLQTNSSAVVTSVNSMESWQCTTIRLPCHSMLSTTRMACSTLQACHSSIPQPTQLLATSWQAATRQTQHHSAMLSSRHSMHSAIAKQVTRWVQTHCQNSITRSEMKVKRFASLSQRSMLHLHSLPKNGKQGAPKGKTSRRRCRTMLQETTSSKTTNQKAQQPNKQKAAQAAAALSAVLSAVQAGQKPASKE